jgi:iron complex transport system permease protein
VASGTALVARSRGRLGTAGLLAALVLLAGASLASITVGSVHVPPGEALQALVAPEATDEHVIVRDVRAERARRVAASPSSLGRR